MSQTTAPSPRTTVKRLPIRASYDREAIRSILDEALICHLGFASGGQPYVIPTIHARRDDHLLIHGSQASRMLRTVRTGVDVCVTVTLLDGLVLARSAFHHSMNYRSVVILGRGLEVIGHDEKLDAMRTLVEHVVPGRWNDARKPNELELKQTMILRLPISEASAKIRTGGPSDDEDDYSLPIWAGVLPLTLTPLAPIADARLGAGTVTPDYVRRYVRPLAT
jgi:nitroimidazol reductase NimA-like FMN-containing flavoprotein (pyridoxamine 5'-phosphate oxidase superfamily)